MLSNAAHFIFDSEHLPDITSRLYGFLSTKEGQFTQIDALPDDLSDATGAWVLVRRTSEGIEITQDSVGSFGLFLFRDGGYWALSNSFNHLLDFLKTGHRLTLNDDYAYAYLAQGICVSLFGETIIREISWLDRRARLFIHPETAELTMSLRDLGEKTIPVDTEEGVRVLDAWHDKWASFIRLAASSWPGKIRVDISGGFDTRMVLATVLSAGIEADRIWFNSNPKHKEDLRIASLLAKEYGLVLNKTPDSCRHPAVPTIERYSERVLEAIFFEKEIYQTPATGQSVVPVAIFSGFGGGMSRSYLEDLDERALAEDLFRRLPRGFSVYRRRIQRGAKSIIRRSIEAVAATYRREGVNVPGRALNGRQFYMETRNRSHFGMSMARNCLSHGYNQAPLLDPLLLKLRAPDGGGHPLLVCALILTRYHEQLASFPFEGERSIPEDTLQLACELNRRFPRKESGPVVGGEPGTVPVWQILQPESEFPPTSGPVKHLPMDEQLKQAYGSPVVQRLFANLFGASVDCLSEFRSNTRHPDMNKFAAVAISKALDDVERGKDASGDFSAFLEARCQEGNDANVLATGGKASDKPTRMHAFLAALLRRMGCPDRSRER